MRASLIIAISAAVGLSGCGPGAFPSSPFFNPNASALAHTNTPPPVDKLAEAQADFRARNFGLAEQLYTQVVESQPKDANAWLGLGAVNDELGRFDLADQDYARVEKLSGTTIALLNNRGYSYMLRGDYRRARNFLLQAQAADPDDSAISRNLQLLDQREAGSDGSASKL